MGLLSAWNNSGQDAWNAAALAVCLWAVVRVVVEPTEEFTRGWTSKLGWIFLVGFGASVAGYFIPVGGALVLVAPPWRHERSRRRVRSDPLATRDILPARYRQLGEKV